MGKREIAVIAATRPPDCILDSDVLFFLQGNQMFLHSMTDSLPDCQSTSTPHPSCFKSSFSSVLFSIPVSHFVFRWISSYYTGCRWKRKFQYSLDSKLLRISCCAFAQMFFLKCLTFSFRCKTSEQHRIEHFRVPGQQQRWQVNSMMFISFSFSCLSDFACM